MNEADHDKLSPHLEEVRPIFTARGNSLICDNRVICAFRYPIKQICHIGNHTIVLLDITYPQMLGNNLYSIGADGQILWQVEYVGSFNCEGANCYIHMQESGTGTFLARTSVGFWAEIYLETGKIARWFMRETAADDDNTVRWQVSANVFICFGEVYVFPYAVYYVSDLGDIIIVTVSMPSTAVGRVQSNFSFELEHPRNAFAFGLDGKCMWQVPVAPTSKNGWYTSAYSKDASTCGIDNWDGVVMYVDKRTGVLKGTELSR